MSIARRIAELYEVKMNAALDRAADPRELVDYSYVQLQDLLAEVRRGAAEIDAAGDGQSCGSATCSGPRTGWAARRNRRCELAGMTWPGRRWPAALRCWLRFPGCGSSRPRCAPRNRR
jgi:hypothetical protein